MGLHRIPKKIKKKISRFLDHNVTYLAKVEVEVEAELGKMTGLAQ